VTTMPPTYCVCSWDHEEDRWHLEAEGLPLFAIRGPVRELLARGYDWDCSILVERETL
jgi:hypothetical protein